MNERIRRLLVSGVALCLAACSASADDEPYDVPRDDAAGEGGEADVVDVPPEGDEGGGAEDAPPAEDGGGDEAADDGPADDGSPMDCVLDEDCDDGIDCTVDTCDPTAGTCVATPDDSICSDGNACNGTEACAAGAGCLPGTPIDCDDGVACTEDACDPLTADCSSTPDHEACTGAQLCDPASGGCVDPPACTTDDECSDGDACNGTETCGAGGVCVRGAPVSCDDAIDCTVDRCNTIDGSCEHAPNAGACGNGVFCDGDEVCDAHSGCIAGPARDCSDGILCTQDRCHATRDSCVHEPDDALCDNAQFCDGTETCQAGAGCASGTPPTCSDGVACTTDSCDSAAAGGAGACAFAAADVDRDTYPDAACSGTDCNDTEATVHPGATEACNRVDDDCDASTDEVFPCSSGATQSCPTSCSTTGTQTCTTTCSWGACQPPAETCNGRDDDCDTVADNGFTCSPGSTRGCTTSCSTTGTQVCTSACGWGTCTPPAETCNGRDDDCDAATDDGFTCAAGATGSCPTGCGSTGSRVCLATCAWGTCTPPAETCNGLDDDCDTVLDDGFSCIAGATGSCPTGCGSTGSRICSAACGWGTCAPPAEIYNFADDDCDGTTDEGYSVLAWGYDDCTGTSGACPPGYSPRGSFKVDSGTCGGGPTGASYDGHTLYAGWLTLCSPTDDVILVHGGDDCPGGTGGGCPTGYTTRASFKVDGISCSSVGPSGTDYFGYALRSGWLHLCSRTTRESIELASDDCTGTTGSCPGGTTQRGTWKPDVVACNPSLPSAVTTSSYPLNAGWLNYCVQN